MSTHAHRQSERGAGKATTPLREFHNTTVHRMGNALATVLARAGIGPFWLLTTRGRKTGRPYINPVTLVEQDGKSWLVAPYGAVSWVRNARAAGRVSIARRSGSFDYSIREVGPDEAAPILKRYVRIASATRPYFQANKDSSVEEFRAEAKRHPVFELTPVNADAP